MPIQLINGLQAVATQCEDRRSLNQRLVKQIADLDGHMQKLCIICDRSRKLGSDGNTRRDHIQQLRVHASMITRLA